MCIGRIRFLGIGGMVSIAFPRHAVHSLFLLFASSCSGGKSLLYWVSSVSPLYIHRQDALWRDAMRWFSSCFPTHTPSDVASLNPVEGRHRSRWIGISIHRVAPFPQKICPAMFYRRIAHPTTYICQNHTIADPIAHPPPNTYP